MVIYLTGGGVCIKIKFIKNTRFIFTAFGGGIMEKLARMNLLYDFYGQLLTERQRRFVELYYAHDLSLGEIAEEFGVSRQAVYDILKRSEQSLTDYESKLGLVFRHLHNCRLLGEVLELLESGYPDKLPEIKMILKQVMATEEE
jgi:predicted DNA-binding protein YlxM (UPF0122 family)